MRRAGSRWVQIEAPFVRTSDTSVRAAEIAQDFASTLRAVVFLAIVRAGARGLTDEEGAAVTNLSPNTYRPRRVELCDGREGRPVLIEPKCQRFTKAGREAVAWWWPGTEVPQ